MMCRVLERSAALMILLYEHYLSGKMFQIEERE